jgi:hypothetical protein
VRETAARLVRWLLLAAAAYTSVLLVRYYLVPGVPRYPLESAWFILILVGLEAVALRGDGSTPADEGSGRLFPGAWRLFPIGFVAGSLLLYAPALQIGLLSDDYVIADWASRLELIHLAETGFVRPGVPLFWAMLAVLPGDLATALHAANLVLHGLNAALVVVLARRLDVPKDQAAAAGAMFAVFPGLSEALVWASGMQDVLMTTLTMTAVVAASSRPAPRMAFAVLAALFALMVKETAVVIPALVALVFIGRGVPRFEPRERLALGMLTALSVAYAVARLLVGVPSAWLEISDWRYFIKQLVAGSFAAVGAPWTDPWGRSHAALALVRTGAVLWLAVVAFLTSRRGHHEVRAAVACALWVLLPPVAAFSLFFVGSNLEGARYVYLSAAGFCVLLAMLAGVAARLFSDAARPAALGVIMLMLAVPAVPAIRSDIARWRTATSVRDEVLDHLQDANGRPACTTFIAEESADSVEGAYVFRHGLREALAIPADPPAGRCRVRLADGEFSVIRE